ncbi:hypothetical protein ACFQ1Q_05625 [Winogradskyella litorisediminis]|uniref:Lipoprotein n=1 Tax=Winogradskyella litorisediminis TaxID=1156618 RepID=A0ABW3N4T6_9FLAO
MKFIFSLLTIVMLADSCNAPKQAMQDSEKSLEQNTALNKTPITTDKQKAFSQNEDLVVSYKASARGYTKYIAVSEKAVKLSSDYSLQKMETYNCDNADWEAIKTLVKNINPKEFMSLKAPSDKHTFDGAAHTTLTVIIGDVAHVTPTFDEGNPPKEIKELVNKVLAIGAKVKKQ